MPEAEPVVLARTAGRVRHLTLNRAEALNALNRDVLAALAAEVDAVRADRSVGCVVLDGSGDRAFCAGADLAELMGLDAGRARALLHRGQQVFAAVEALPVPVIAAVDGFALGGGLELVLACPLVVASTRSRFGLPESRLGLMPGYGGTQRLRRAMGRAPALHLMLTGRPLDAEQAWQLGLLSRPPVPAEELPDLVDELAADVAGLSRTNIGLILEASRAGGTAEDALLHEAALGAIAIASRDGQEGIRSFQEKRPPEFGGGSR